MPEQGLGMFSLETTGSRVLPFPLVQRLESEEGARSVQRRRNFGDRQEEDCKEPRRTVPGGVGAAAQVGARKPF